MFCSTVRTSSFGPPKENAALILFFPLPGMGTYESRGMEISAGLPLGGMYMIIIVSVRWPAALPVPSFFRSAFDRPSRESEPTSRYVVPGCAAGRWPDGVSSTRWTWLQACSGTATSQVAVTRTSSSTMRKTFRTGCRLRGLFLPGAPCGSSGGGPGRTRRAAGADASPGTPVGPLDPCPY